MTNDKGRRFVKAGYREDRKFGICARKPVHRAIGANYDISVYATLNGRETRRRSGKGNYWIAETNNGETTA